MQLKSSIDVCASMDACILNQNGPLSWCGKLMVLQQKQTNRKPGWWATLFGMWHATHTIIETAYLHTKQLRCVRPPQKTASVHTSIAKCDCRIQNRKLKSSHNHQSTISSNCFIATAPIVLLPGSALETQGSFLSRSGWIRLQFHVQEASKLDFPIITQFSSKV